MDQMMDFKGLRAIGLGNVKRNWGLAIGAGAIAFLLAGIGTTFFPNIEWSRELTHLFGYELQEGTRVSFNFSPTGIVSMAQFIIGGTIQLGYCKFLLKQHDNTNPEFNDVFSEFDRFGDGFLQHFLRALYTALWTLLLIIPGIIKSLSYAMTPYIMAENPGMKANEAITRSQELMDGHKMDLFWLHLTFIGWDLLAVLTMSIGHLWLNPYKNAAEAAFYRQISRKELPGT